MQRLMAIGLFVAALAGAYETRAADAPPRFEHALRLRAEGHASEAFAELEALFDSTVTSPEDRVRAARVCASATDTELKRHRASDYAEWLLQLRPRETIYNSPERIALMRVRAEQLYDSAHWSEARTLYEALARETDSPVRDEATLRLGWIDLNEDHPDRAYARWLERLQAGPVSILRMEFARDLGRAFIEARGAPLREATPLFEQPEFLAAFVEGARRSLPRLGHEPAALAAIGRALDTSSTGPAVAESLLASVEFAKTPTCSVLEWGSLARNIDLPPWRDPLSACEAWIMGNPRRPGLNRLLEIYERDSSPVALRRRALQMRRARQDSLGACIHGLSFAMSGPVTNEDRDALADDCQRAPITSELRIAAIRFWQSEAAITDTPLAPAIWLSDADLHVNLFNRVMRDKNAFAATLLPARLADTSTDPSEARTLFDAYALHRFTATAATSDEQLMWARILRANVGKLPADEAAAWVSALERPSSHKLSFEQLAALRRIALTLRLRIWPAERNWAEWIDPPKPDANNQYIFILTQTMYDRALDAFLRMPAEQPIPEGGGRLGPQIRRIVEIVRHPDQPLDELKPLIGRKESPLATFKGEAFDQIRNLVSIANLGQQMEQLTLTPGRRFAVAVRHGLKTLERMKPLALDAQMPPSVAERARRQLQNATDSFVSRLETATPSAPPADQPALREISAELRRWQSALVRQPAAESAPSATAKIVIDLGNSDVESKVRHPSLRAIGDRSRTDELSDELAEQLLREIETYWSGVNP